MAAVKLGRPTKYDDSFPELMEKMMFEEGWSVTKFCRHIRISRETFYAWAQEHQDFSDAWKRGRTSAEALYEEMGEKNLENTKFNFGLYKFLMNNKFGWADKKEIAQTTEISIGAETNRKVRQILDESR